MNLCLGLFGFIFGAWGILIGWRSKREATEYAVRAATQAAEYTSKLTSLTALTTDLTSTVQTRAIGRFPDNLRPIIDLIGRAKSTILIATDVSSYGQLSNPRECRNYYSAIIAAAARGGKVQLIAYSGQRSDAERRNQFAEYVRLGPTKGYEKLAGEPRWKAFTAAHPFGMISTLDEAFDALLYSDLAFRRNVSEQAVTVHELADSGQSLPVFFWLRDTEEAIFSLFTVGERSREISFRTVDQSITEVLVSTFDGLREHHAQQLDPVADLTRFRPILTRPAKAQAEGHA
jgi:hypothetical protein